MTFTRSEDEVTAGEAREVAREAADAEFVEMVRNSIRWHGLRPLSERLLVSVPTLERWAEGRNLPRQGVRAAIKRGAEISLPRQINSEAK